MLGRSLVVGALAALLAVPAVSSAAPAKRPVKQQSASARPSTAPRSLALGGWVGWEMGDADGFQLRVDGELPFQQLTPEVALSLVGSVGYTNAGYDVFGGELSINRFKFVPAARFTLALNPQLSLFGDAGLGLHYTSVDVEFDGFGFADYDDSEIGLLLRFGAGAFYHVSPQLRVGAQVVLDPIFGDYDDTTFAIMAGLMFQL